jgi:hypothetical protein
MHIRVTWVGGESFLKIQLHRYNARSIKSETGIRTKASIFLSTPWVITTCSQVQESLILDGSDVLF